MVRIIARRAAAAAAAIALAAGLSACTGELVGPPLPASPATADRTIASTGPTPTLSPARVSSEADTRGLESTPWQLVGAKGREVTIRYVAGGGCSRFSGVRVVEAADSVELWTATRTDRTAQACPAMLQLGASTLQLAAPLGDRRLLHAPVSGDWTTFIDNF